MTRRASTYARTHSCGGPTQSYVRPTQRFDDVATKVLCLGRAQEPGGRVGADFLILAVGERGRPGGLQPP